VVTVVTVGTQAQNALGAVVTDGRGDGNEAVTKEQTKGAIEMRIYLAGKVDQEFGHWRDALLGFDWVAGEQRQRWVKHFQEPKETNDYWQTDSMLVLPWAERHGIVLNAHCYVGPYRQRFASQMEPKYTGRFHGVTSYGQHGMPDENGMRAVVSEAMGAIGRADMVFAYINNPDAYGTIAEIGYAVAQGKYVSLLVHPRSCFSSSDYSFVQNIVAHTSYYGPFMDEIPEEVMIKSALTDAFVHYPDWEKPRANSGSVLQEAVSFAKASFRQIARWTSDPRVREEADRMARRLEVIR
jgi:nucleoside 2-deoxyribosyltransferase